MAPIRFGLLQYPISKNRELNWGQVFLLAQKAAKRRPDYLVFPEMWLGSPLKPGARKAWAAFYRATLRKMKVWCAASRIGAFFSQLEEERGRYYNTLYFIGQDGKVGKYRKIHLFTVGNENKIFSAGSRARPWGKIGGIVCYDIRFPELSRYLAHRGIEILIVPAQWPRERMAHWHQLLAVRALENQIYVIGVNRTGRKEGLSFIGGSVAYSPWGERMMGLGKGEEVGMVDVDLDKLQKLRRAYPFFAERKFGL
ncbi:MAG: nitrilase-related carbon-nitrogen hydrolase [Deltaproteobacteria bacterium]|nr:nitrilase-related carbon-nitrogen hydrolase [Deltaproteobacteria bacterium]